MTTRILQVEEKVVDVYQEKVSDFTCGWANLCMSCSVYKWFCARTPHRRCSSCSPGQVQAELYAHRSLPRHQQHQLQRRFPGPPPGLGERLLQYRASFQVEKD